MMEFIKLDRKNTLKLIIKFDFRVFYYKKVKVTDYNF